jgi:uncharacterized repeat protein (TIGR01451 family)
MSPRQKREPDFDASADMRLVDLARATLGVPAPARGSWESVMHAEGASVDPEPPQKLASAVLAVETVATPANDVIPGAIVTLTLSIANEGVEDARGVRVSVPLPGGASFRNGSLVRDGRPLFDDAADEFLGSGILVGTIASKARVTFIWKIGVRLGNKPLVVQPSVRAQASAILGAEPAIVSRRAGVPGAFGSQISRSATGEIPAADDLPIYELDEEEVVEYEAGIAALSSTTAQAEYVPPFEPPLQPVPPPDQPEPAPPPSQPSPVPDPGVPAPEPMIPEPPTQPPDVEPAAHAAPAPRQGVVLTGRIDRPSVAYFERIFMTNNSPTLLNHFILGGALACTRPLRGGDVAGLKVHMDAQGHILQRIVLHEKLGIKEPIGEYAGTMLARIDQFVPADVMRLAPPDDPNIVLLETELEAPALGVLSRMQEDGSRWDFTTARQLTLALQARRICARAPEDRVRAAEDALRAYAQTCATQLQRFFVRMRMDRTTGLLFARDEKLDAAASTLIAALTALF